MESRVRVKASITSSGGATRSQNPSVLQDTHTVKTKCRASVEPYLGFRLVEVVSVVVSTDYRIR